MGIKLQNRPPLPNKHCVFWLFQNSLQNRPRTIRIDFGTCPETFEEHLQEYETRLKGKGVAFVGRVTLLLLAVAGFDASVG
eukprot:6455240-Amphidinium_carterae.1